MTLWEQFVRNPNVCSNRRDFAKTACLENINRNNNSTEHARQGYSFVYLDVIFMVFYYFLSLFYYAMSFCNLWLSLILHAMFLIHSVLHFADSKPMKDNSASGRQKYGCILLCESVTLVQKDLWNHLQYKHNLR